MSRVRRRPSGQLERKDHSVSVRVDTIDWEPAQTRAFAAGILMSEVMGTFIEGYGRGRINPLGPIEARSRRPNGTSDGQVRSVRVDTASWQLATDRAKGVELSLSDVVVHFIRAYGHGRINLPRVQTVYEAVIST